MAYPLYLLKMLRIFLKKHALVLQPGIVIETIANGVNAPQELTHRGIKGPFCILI